MIWSLFSGSRNPKWDSTGSLIWLIVLGFNDTSTLVSHFVSSPRERGQETEGLVEEMKERDREERWTGMKVKKQKK